MHIVVATVAHGGDDARIVHRQARILLEKGHQVTVAGPLPTVATTDPPGLTRIGLHRASGFRRLSAWRGARLAIKALCQTADVDIIILHDIELLPIIAGQVGNVPVVWDVHEDFVFSVQDRKYIPRALRGIIRSLVRQLERWACRNFHIILAEDSYRHRLGDHPVIRNSVWIPDEVPSSMRADQLPRAVYVGRISRGRGALELIEIGKRLQGRVLLQLIGDADLDVRRELLSAHESGYITWLGRLPNPEANRLIQGSLTGFSLLHNLPNYVNSLPTKIVEYLAHGVPVITTDIPLAADLVRSSNGGVIVPMSDIVEASVAEINLRLKDPERRISQGKSGYQYVRDHHSWLVDGERFTALLESWALKDKT